MSTTTKRVQVTIGKSNRSSSKRAAFVSFLDFDYELVKIVKSIRERYFDNLEKTWEVPTDMLTDLIEKLSGKCELILDSEAKALIETSNEEPDIDLSSVSFKTPPYDYQVEGVKYGLTHDKWILGDEMGLGKSKQAIDIAVAKKENCGYRRCLIICGVNTLKWNWVNEVHTHSDEKAFILGQKETKNGIKIGSSADKLSSLENLPDAYFLITNVETLRQEEICSKLEELCKTQEIGMIVFDEAHKCKDIRAAQTRGLMQLNADTMIAMTGTPLMNSPLDLYAILKWIGAENRSFYSFRNYYCEMGGYGGHEVIKYKNLNILADRLNSVMLRRRKEDCLDLPEKIYIDECVEMTSKQEKVYKEVLTRIMEDIDKVAEANDPLSELIRLRQATGFTGILSSDISESAKLDRMMELVEEARLNTKKVVIFSNWTDITTEAEHRLSEICSVASITGDTKDEDRKKIVDEFQNGKLDAVIGTIGAMGTGITLTAGTVEIFLDEPWNKANKDQAEDRCHRIGQSEKLTIYTLMCKDTIDERIHQIVESKGFMADKMVDGRVTSKKALVLQLIGKEDADYEMDGL